MAGDGSTTSEIITIKRKYRKRVHGASGLLESDAIEFDFRVSSGQINRIELLVAYDDPLLSLLEGESFPMLCRVDVTVSITHNDFGGVTHHVEFDNWKKVAMRQDD